MKSILFICASFCLLSFSSNEKIDKPIKPQQEIVEIHNNRQHPIYKNTQFDGSILIEVQTNQHEVLFSKREPSHTLSTSFKTKNEIAVELKTADFTKRIELSNQGASSPNYMVARISEKEALDLKNVFSKHVTLQILDITKGKSFEEAMYAPVPIVLSSPLVQFDRVIDSSAISINDIIQWNADSRNSNHVVVRIEEVFISTGNEWPEGKVFHFITPDDGKLAVSDIKKYISNGDYFRIEITRYNEHIIRRSGKKYQIVVMSTSDCMYKYRHS